jgi:hypothetical protein
MLDGGGKQALTHHRHRLRLCGMGQNLRAQRGVSAKNPGHLPLSRPPTGPKHGKGGSVPARAAPPMPLPNPAQQHLGGLPPRQSAPK